MAVIDWPATLPQITLQQGYSEGNVDNLIVTGMASGPEKRRPKGTEGYLPVTITMNLTYAQKVIFDDFYKNTITYGAEPFNLSTFGTNILDCYLNSKNILPLSGTKWKLTMNVITLA